MLLLIDADSALYRAGCANETRFYKCVMDDGGVLATFKYKKDAKEYAEECGAEVVGDKTVGPVGITLSNLRNVIDTKMLCIDHTSYELYIGGKGNFRFDIYPEYKEQRDELAKPLHIPQMRKHLQGKYGAILVDDEEADDRVSWRQMQCIEQGIESCIVTIDKDLNNTEGWHYNWGKEELYYVTPEEADLNFFRQVIMGDSTDGLAGIPNKGKAYALKVFPEHLPYKEMYDRALQEYTDAGLDKSYFVQQGRCLWMRRKPDELWPETS